VGDREQFADPVVQPRNLRGQLGVGGDQSVELRGARRSRLRELAELRAQRLVLAPQLSDGGHVAT
jgi:hypothetical protein